MGSWKHVLAAVAALVPAGCSGVGGAGSAIPHATMRTAWAAVCIGRGIVAHLKHGPRIHHLRADENKADEGSFGYAAESRRLNVPGAKHLVH